MRVLADERMEWKCVPQKRQRLDVLDRRPYHRCAGFGRSLWSARRFAIAAIFAEEAAVDAAEHDGLARECDACQAAAAMTRRLADEKHSGLADFFEVQAQVLATDRVRV